MIFSARRKFTALPMAFLYFAEIPLTLMTTGCTDQAYTSPEQQAQNACRALGPKTLSGALIGGVGGAGTGAAIGALAGGGKGAGIGALAGGVLGVGIGLLEGHHLDAQDCQQAQIALQQVRYTDVGQAVSWANPATGSYGSYTPLSTETVQPSGQLCRQVRQDSTIKNHAATSQIELTCRDANGNYTTVQTPQATTPSAVPR